MTPSQIEQMARERYNAVGDSFWSQSEIFSYLTAASEEIATESECIQRTYSATTVSGTAEYSLPTSAIGIKRVTYDGRKLEPISMRESDSLTLNNSSSTMTGVPQYYTFWNGTLTLFPAPNDALALKIYSVNEPQAISVNSTLETPAWTHTRLVNPVVAKMAEKDQNFEAAKYFNDKWDKDKIEIARWMKKQKRGDAFTGVIDEDALPNTILGLT